MNLIDDHNSLVIQTPRQMAKSDYHRVRIFLFSLIKFSFDRIFALTVLPIVAMLALMLWLINPFFNPGPVFFVQTRMGKDGTPFRMVKFRTMLSGQSASRAPDSPLELDRITPLGRVLRRTRLDELPNFLNVLKGEMSVIGPRPDSLNHGETFWKSIPGYAERHLVRPGITGLAQVNAGYAEGREATREKVSWDIRYIRRYGFRQDIAIVLRTAYVMLSGFGAR